ncbi:MAG: hypothetical protein A2Y09_04550 [Planctomycetes bacterium GWA2_39_15]|nr:MAG: hypothetical protein A2Y09_04550 [Planctomycetes bacterium GWA2_39_15]
MLEGKLCLKFLYIKVGAIHELPLHLMFRNFKVVGWHGQTGLSVPNLTLRKFKVAVVVRTLVRATLKKLPKA